MNFKIITLGSEPDESEYEAYNTIIAFEENYANLSSEQKAEGSKFTHNINQIRNEKFIGSPLKILARIGSISNPRRIRLNIDDKEIYKSIFTITLIDKGSTLHVIDLPYDLYWEPFLEMFNSNKPALFKGTLLPPFNSSIESYTLYLKDYDTEISRYDLLNETYYSMADLKAKTESNAINNNNGIRGYIKDTLISKLGIEGLDRAKELDKAIDFMILQSLTFGRNLDGKYSNKLHSLVIGGPASGKKLLTIIAAILNPVFYEVASSADKVTPAGLVGKVIHKNNQSISSPGYFPLASHGILCIQDFHEIVPKISKISGILSMVMEDGKVIDSTSAMTTHEAITSLHIDMNRISQVKLDTSTNKYSDINIPLNIISRFDFIIEFPSDLERQFNTAIYVATKEKLLGSSLNKLEEEEWVVKLRGIIAYLLSRYIKAEMSESAIRHLGNKLDQFEKENHKHRKSQKHLDSMLIRMAISIKKFAKAIACAEMSEIITEQHIDEALGFIFHKLEFLQNYDSIETQSFQQTKTDKIPERRASILRLLSGRTLSIREVYSEIGSINKSISERTIDRDLMYLETQGKVIHEKHGQWIFPIAVEENR